MAGDSVQTDLSYNATGANYVLPMTEVAWAANGPYWLKNLTSRGTVTGVNRPVLTEGVPGHNTLTLVENIRIGGNVPWTDWHEVFGTDGMSWQSATIYYAGTTTEVSGLAVVISNGGGDDVHADNLDFYFDTLEVGTEITIVKTMVWEGLDVTMGSEQLGSDTIVIREFPTVIPEPATLSLLALGGGLFGLLRRRRNA
ncbi:PEP-CTERM sorting domain-containing protein [bacterium]|nr:PEP-CTERM sorting domain-containing protein [bacterium]